MTTFATLDDSLNDALPGFAKKLEKFISVEQQFVEGSLTVSLNGSFGSGKSTFLRMWEHRLNDIDYPPTVITLNAWKSDYLGDPLVSILSAFLESIEGKSPETWKIINEGVKDITAFLGSGVKQLASKVIDVGKMKDEAEEKKKERALEMQPAKALLELYKKRTAAFDHFADSLRKVAEENPYGVYILVDELDRCRPDYAISFLETINHFFDVEGIVFILAVDIGQLECALKATFGGDLQFDEYFRKFVQRQVRLPEISEDSYRFFVESYIENLLKKKKIRDTALQFDSSFLQEILYRIRLNPRQLQEVFRTLGHACANAEFSGTFVDESTAFRTFLLCALRVGNRVAYEDLAEGRLSIGYAGSLCASLPNHYSKNYFLGEIIAGGGFDLREVETAEDFFGKSGLPKVEIHNTDYVFQKWNPGQYRNRFKNAYHVIEGLSEWIVKD